MSEQKRLDAETERLINLMDYRDRRQGYSGPSVLAIALRQRIRQLVDEAEQTGIRVMARVVNRDVESGASQKGGRET